MTRLIFFVCITFIGCQFESNSSNAKYDKDFVSSILQPTLDSLLNPPDDKVFAIYWRNKILNGHYRRKFIEIKADSFQVVKKINRGEFEELRNAIQDSALFEFKHGEKRGRLLLLNHLEDEKLKRNHFIIEASASPPVLNGDSGLVYIETADLFYHNGEGVICELKFKNDTWFVERVITAWSMRMDTVRLGVFQ